MPSSNSLRQPSHHPNASTNRLSTPLPALDEDHELGQLPSNNGSESTLTNPEQSQAKSTWKSKIPFWKKKEQEKKPATDANADPYRDDVSANYSSGMVDVLDTIDPEVMTLTSLTNMQNSLFIPNLPWLNRHPTYNIKHQENEALNPALQSAYGTQAEEPQSAPQLQRTQTGTTTTTLMTIDSHLTDSRFAVLPENTDLSGWSSADKKEVNDHVRHMLHSKRSKIKRSLKGFGQYVKRRKYLPSNFVLPILKSYSTWLPRHSLCHAYHPIRSRMGAFLNRLDQRWWSTNLCCPHH
jgi:hypothetical protein